MLSLHVALYGAQHAADDASNDRGLTRDVLADASLTDRRKEFISVLELTSARLELTSILILYGDEITSALKTK
jgi:hypothetical protein